MFCCEIWEMSSNTFYYRTSLMVTSENTVKSLLNKKYQQLKHMKYCDIINKHDQAYI